MKNFLIPAIWDILPSNMDCEIDKDLHNVSVDADGSIRLCLRIRGTFTPKMVSLKNLLNDKEYCKLCNHTCQLMSKYIDRNDLGADDLVHLDRRN